MLRTILPSFYRHRQVRSLHAKLLLPIAGLMLLSLLGSVLAFLGGTVLTQDQLLQQQTAAEAERVVAALNMRVADTTIAATMLAHDPQVIAALRTEGEAGLGMLNSRAVAVRDRLGLDLIQIYDRQGTARANLVLASLYRESSLLDQVEIGAPAVRVVAGRVLLLSRAALPDEAGTVIAGLDLEEELNRLAARLRLAADLGLSLGDTHIGTRAELPFDASGGWQGNQYSRRLPLMLGQTTVDLVLVRPTDDIARVTATGLAAMVGSTLLTTLLLLGLGVVITRAIVRPIQQLSAAAAAVAQGDLGQQVDVAALAGALDIGREDEIGRLALDFNRMVDELSGVYGSLEARVAARTRELAIAAEVARAVSASLDLDDVLQRSAQVIQERGGFHRVSLFIVEPGSNLAVLRAAAGPAGALAGERESSIPLGSRTLVGLVAATGQPRVVQDLTTEPLYPKTPLLLDTHAAAAIPLLAGQTVIGVLEVQSQQRQVFTPEIVQLLRTLADQIAIGVQNARLYTRQRQAAEHLAQVDRLKTQFLANMSHELRTPLNSIIGFSKILLKGLNGPLNEAQAHDLTLIHQAGQHLLSLIEDILDISQINAGQMKLFYEEMDLREIVDGVLGTAAALVQNKPILLHAQLDPALPTIYADKRRLRQVLLNLVSNAIKFTESGQVKVQARAIEGLNPQTERLEPFLEISVSDTGIGIAPEQQVDIFKEFSQVDASLSRRAGGTGLGLSITRKLVELHGGWIWVKSQLGQGATFTFVLPLHRANGAPTDTLAPPEINVQEVDHVA